MDVNFPKSLSIQKKLEQVIIGGGYSIEEIESNAKWAYITDGAEDDPLTMGAVPVLCSLSIAVVLSNSVFNVTHTSVPGTAVRSGRKESVVERLRKP